VELTSKRLVERFQAKWLRRARAHDVPVVALAGTIGEGAGVNYEAGIHAYASIVQRPMILGMAMEEAEQLLTDAAEGTIRMVLIG
jgi:hypothetical protein